MSNNTALKSLSSYSTNLSTICINSDQWTVYYNWYKSSNTNYSYSCVTGLEKQEHSTSTKAPFQVFDILGKQVDERDMRRGVYLYKYSNGITRKTFQE